MLLRFFMIKMFFENKMTKCKLCDMIILIKEQYMKKKIIFTFYIY